MFSNQEFGWHHSFASCVTIFLSTLVCPALVRCGSFNLKIEGVLAVASRRSWNPTEDLKIFSGFLPGIFSTCNFEDHSSILTTIIKHLLASDCLVLSFFSHIDLLTPWKHYKLFCTCIRKMFNCWTEFFYTLYWKLSNTSITRDYREPLVCFQAFWFGGIIVTEAKSEWPQLELILVSDCLVLSFFLHIHLVTSWKKKVLSVSGRSLVIKDTIPLHYNRKQHLRH